VSVAIEIDKLAQGILEGSERALSRGLTLVERGGDLSEDLLGQVYPHTGRAHVVGLTGSPGAGKSTLTAGLAREARNRGIKVGVIAIDPSSPYSGGSILGDRIRMNDVAFEMDVFIRSLATHGAMGGLSRAVTDSVDLMDASGKELIFVETVGVGQDEVDVMGAVHTVAVVSVPGLGDEIQTLKAGILEIADIHVVNKADREGANRIQAELRSMLTLSGSSKSGWQPPILPCVAVNEDGIVVLLDTMRKHLRFLKSSGEFEQRRKRMVKAHVLSIAHDLVSEATNQECESADLLERVVRRELAPHAAGRALLARLVSQKEGF
jgi:LAO/AO transport system kinase